MRLNTRLLGKLALCAVLIGIGVACVRTGLTVQQGWKMAAWWSAAACCGAVIGGMLTTPERGKQDG